MKTDLQVFFGPLLTWHGWRWIGRNALVLVATPWALTATYLAFSASTAPTVPVIPLSADPLYAASAGDKPVLALALSVEFPTVGAQYVDPDNNNNSTTDDVTYSPTIEYLGYYDAESCYTYDDSQTSDAKRFVRRGPAIALSTPNTANPTWTTRMCWNGTTSYTKDDGTTPASSTTSNDAFSGNFLNWASSSAIDMLRLSLTGGDRVIDTPTLTVLQRAIIPAGDPINMWNSSNFPSKRLYRSGTSRAITSANFAAASYASGVPYFGAVPSSMATAAGSNDIFVANRLNQIYFGTAKSATVSSYTLGTSGSGAYQIGTISNSSESLSVSYQIGTFANSSATTRPSDTTKCANDTSQTCVLPSGTWEIWYGRDDGFWRSGPATGSVPCNDSVLGDRGGKTNERCYYRPYSGSWSPSATATKCADENGTCALPTGTWEVLYGANTSWKVAPATGALPCTNALWTDPLSGVAKACYYRPYSGSWTPTTSSSTALNSDGFFYARVQVCDRDPSTFALREIRYWNLCSRYSDGDTTPHASYKPTGAIQKYSDQLRLAAFGYLMDQNTSRYGGVLRAPIKYVGSKLFDINGVESASTNANAEWNAVTGVFIENPDNQTTPTTDGRNINLSGVINYINQFGRTGSVAGRYKKYDPIGELHYQALRYLQGLQPTPEAISGLTDAMKDGFPVYTTWTDPYGGGRSSTADYSCLKSNIVVIGDINAWDYNSRLPTASAADNIPDIAYWQGIAAKFESNTTGTYIDGAGTSRTIANPNTANSATLTSVTGDTSIVGSAYWAHTHDIRGTSWTNATASGTAGTDLQRPGLRVKTFAFDVNEYGGSNNATTRRTRNQLFRAAKYGGFESDPSNLARKPYNTYGNPFVNEADGSNNNYVWEDTDTRASRVGEANSYFLQSDARGVLSAFDDIFSRASTAARSIAGGAIQSKNLTQAGNTIFQGTFDTSDWSGDLLAVPVSVNSSNVVTISNSTSWTAATQLGALSAPATSRNIVVGKRFVPATATTAATAFTWSDIEADLATDLNRLNPSATADGRGQDRLNYLRGDRSLESNPFRRRNKLLGDIINSGVAYSGEPTRGIVSTSYSAFYLQQIEVPGDGGHAARTPAVFVGANDGMLHAFNATDGNELFAYIPSWLGPKLSALTDPTYVNAHQSYVDGTPVVAEAQVGTAGTADDWKTVLVSGTGGGGIGVFALDVTNPAAFSASKVMWEFTNNDDPDMGYVLGKPQILKFRTSAPGATTPTYKWFAVVASGVNNYAVANSSNQYGSGYPALFLLDLAKPMGTSWTEGTNYYKISVPVNGDLSHLTDGGLNITSPTGLINFKATLNLGGQVEQIYMGDLHGNLWKLDFTKQGVSDWNMGKLSPFNNGTESTPIPLFIAKDNSDNLQPITMAPSIAFGPTPGSSLILFGTGKYMENADKSSTSTQTEYMVFDDGWDHVDTLVGSETRSSAISGRTRLKQGTANVSTGLITTPAFNLGLTTTQSDSEATRSGWYADLPVSGERQISNAGIAGAKATFGSLIPGASSTGVCGSSGGGGNQYTVDILTGNGSFINSTVGIMGEPLLSELTGATTSTISDSTGKRLKTTTTQVIQQGSSGLAVGGTVTNTITVGRLSWRQINNYQDLKNAP